MVKLTIIISNGKTEKISWEVERGVLGCKGKGLY